MIRWMLAAALLLAAKAAPAQNLLPVAARTLGPGTVLAPADIASGPADRPGVVADPSRLVGMRTLVAVYRGQPFPEGAVAPPLAVRRNAVVRLLYAQGAVRLTAEGRALDEAAAGEALRVLNLASRTVVTGRARADGAVEVGS